MGEPPPEPSLPPGLATAARQACVDRIAFVRNRRDEIEAAIGDGVQLVDIFDGEMTGVGAPAEPVLVEDRVIVATTKVLPLVEAIPHMGKVTSRRLLGRLAIGESTRVERLDDTQRSALLAGIDAHRAETTTGPQP